MFGKAKVSLDKGLFERVERLAGRAGYASADELIVHVLERELAKLEDAGSEEELKERLRGLGYIS